MASGAFGLLLLHLSPTPAAAVVLDLIEGADDPVAELTGAALAPSSGISIVGGSGAFVGDVGDGSDPNTAQSATYSDFSLQHQSGSPTLNLPDGIVLTSGTANIPSTNTNTSFDPFIPGTGGDADLTAILQDAGAPSSVVNDANSITFSFTVDDPNNNAVQAQFVFGSDEFPDQAVTDVFGFFVDGVNYAFFPDGSLVSFVTGVNADQFLGNDVGTGNFPIEYDGVSRVLTVTGLLDDSLTEHILKIAIGDTADSVFDSGVFLGGLQAAFTTGGGGIGDGDGPPTGVPEPGTLGLLLTGLIGLGAAAASRRWARQAF